VRPELVAESGFAEWTQHGVLRQPRFEGLRTDKRPRDCRRERPRDAGGDVTEAEGNMLKAKSSAADAALDEYGAKRDFSENPRAGLGPGPAT
jgi:bifunctional non-homologous end joining protein LigD